MECEEGITTYCEEQTGTTSLDTMRDYASRAIAVDCVYRGVSFVETFLTLVSLGVHFERAFGVSVRCHRAGGYCKDHCYLQVEKLK